MRVTLIRILIWQLIDVLREMDPDFRKFQRNFPTLPACWLEGASESVTPILLNDGRELARTTVHSEVTLRCSLHIVFLSIIINITVECGGVKSNYVSVFPNQLIMPFSCKNSHILINLLKEAEHEQIIPPFDFYWSKNCFCFWRIWIKLRWAALILYFLRNSRTKSISKLVFFPFYPWLKMENFWFWGCLQWALRQ